MEGRQSNHTRPWLGALSSRSGVARSRGYRQTRWASMMRAPLFAIALSSVSDAVCAQPANGAVTGLESCFQAARIADAICSKLPNDPAQRLDCFQKTRAAQLECLEHVLSATPAEPTTPKAPSGTARPEPPAAATRPEGPTERAPPEQPSQSGLSEKSDSP